jgi:hypothetical protein
MYAMSVATYACMWMLSKSDPLSEHKYFQTLKRQRGSTAVYKTALEGRCRPNGIAGAVVSV